MNNELMNICLSRLTNIIGGVCHAKFVDGISLSKNQHTIHCSSKFDCLTLYGPRETAMCS